MKEYYIKIKEKIRKNINYISRKRFLKQLSLIIQIIAFPIIITQLIFTCNQIGSVKVVIDDIKYNAQKMDEMISSNPFLNNSLNIQYPVNFIEFDKSLTDKAWDKLPDAALSLHKLNDKAYSSGRLFDFNLEGLYDTISVYYNNIVLMNGMMEMAWNLLYREQDLTAQKKALLTKKIMYHTCYKLIPYLKLYSKLNDEMILKLNAIIDNLEGTKPSKN